MAPTQLLLEGPAIEPLLRRVREEHGPDVRIVKAERVRVGGIGGFFAREQYEVTVEVADPAPRPAPAPWSPPPPVAVQAAPAPTHPSPKDRRPSRSEARAEPRPEPRAERPTVGLEALLAAAERADLSSPPLDAPVRPVHRAPEPPPREVVLPAQEAAPAAVDARSPFEAVFAGIADIRDLEPRLSTGGIPTQRRRDSDTDDLGDGDSGDGDSGADASAVRAAMMGEEPVVLPDTPLLQGGRDEHAPVDDVPTEAPGEPDAAHPGQGETDDDWTPPWEPPVEQDRPWEPVALGASRPIGTVALAEQAAGTAPDAVAPAVVQLPDDETQASRPRGRRRAEAPAGEEELAERLATLGVPARWLRHLPQTRAEALAFLAERIGATPTQVRRRTPTTLAPVTLVLADIASALPVARQLAVGLGLDATDVVLAHRKVAGVPREQCAPTRAELLSRIQHARQGGLPLVAVLPAPVGASASARRALATTVALARADELWAVVDATRRVEDTSTWLRGLVGGAGVDAVALANVDVTGAPGAALDLPAPVVLLGDRPATPQAWVSLLATRLIEQDLT